MGSSNQSDWEQKLRDLEKEVNNTINEPLPVRPFNPNGEASQPIQRLLGWYQGLSSPAKVGVGAVAAILALFVLNSVLKLVASLIAIAILSIILYGLYRAFVSSDSSQR